MLLLVVVVVVAQVSRPCLGSSLRISSTMEDFTSAILAARWCAAAGRRRGASVRVSRVSLEPGVLTVLAPAAAAAAHLSRSCALCCWVGRTVGVGPRTTLEGSYDERKYGVWGIVRLGRYFSTFRLL